MNINTRSEETKSRENRFVKEALEGINRLEHTYYTRDNVLFNYIKVVLLALIRRRAKGYIRSVFQKYVDKRQLEGYVTKKYKEYNVPLYIGKLADMIIEYYDNRDNMVNGISYKSYVNNIITLDTNNIQLDEQYLVSNLKGKIRNDKRFDIGLSLLKTKLVTAIIRIWVYNNMIDSIVNENKARLGELLHIHIKNDIQADCTQAIINTLIGTGQNYYNDIEYEYFKDHDIVSMLTQDRAKVQFITLE